MLGCFWDVLQASLEYSDAGGSFDNLSPDSRRVLECTLGLSTARHEVPLPSNAKSFARAIHPEDSTHAVDDQAILRSNAERLAKRIQGLVLSMGADRVKDWVDDTRPPRKPLLKVKVQENTGRSVHDNASKDRARTAAKVQSGVAANAGSSMVANAGPSITTDVPERDAETIYESTTKVGEHIGVTKRVAVKDDLNFMSSL